MFTKTQFKETDRRVYHTTGFTKDQIIDLCVMVRRESHDSRLVVWPPILGLFRSVVVTLTYLRRNRVQVDLDREGIAIKPDTQRWTLLDQVLPDDLTKEWPDRTFPRRDGGNDCPLIRRPRRNWLRDDPLPPTGTLMAMEDWSIMVRPTVVARLVYLPLYMFAPMIGAGLLLLIDVPIVIAVRGSFRGQAPGWAVPLLALGWVALSVPGFILVHRAVRFFLDRARLRLTPTTLYLGRGERPVPLGEVRAAYFVTQHGLGRRKYRTANRGLFNVLLLVLDDGSLAPLSPPPGQFTDLVPDTYAATTNVAQFLHAIVAILEPKLRDGEPLPPQALPFLHPMESNRLHHPSQPPRTGIRWTLARWTWLF